MKYQHCCPFLFKSVYSFLFSFLNIVGFFLIQWFWRAFWINRKVTHLGFVSFLSNWFSFESKISGNRIELKKKHVFHVTWTIRTANFTVFVLRRSLHLVINRWTDVERASIKKIISTHSLLAKKKMFLLFQWIPLLVVKKKFNWSLQWFCEGFQMFSKNIFLYKQL